MVEGTLVAVIAGVILAALGALTRRGRQLASGFWGRVRRRPAVPPARVVIAALPASARWVRVHVEGDPIPHVTLHVVVTATYFGGLMNLEIVHANTSLKGEVRVASFTHWRDGMGWVDGIDLESGVSTRIQIAIVVRGPSP